MPIRTCIDCGEKKRLIGEVRSKRCHSCASSISKRGKRKTTGRTSRYYTTTRDGKVMYEHRYVMEQHLGRKLLDNEHIHHMDGNPKNNDISNLEILSPEEHHRLHMTEQNEKYNQHIKAANARWGN